MPNDPFLGRVIDAKYRIDAEIGAGGMATIYRATRLQIGDDVAIKILHAEFLRDPKFTERFQREAQAAARLKHPNAVTIHDFGVSEDGIIYLIMELVEGQNLRTIIKKEGPMTAAAAANVIRQVCAALTEAHRQNIIHRDIKPANIALSATHDGIRVKVLDFGIASLRGGTMMTLTQAGDLMGTPAYMSPEQCLGEELDSRSDIYSLGVVLFEMLSGVVPFNSPTVTAVVMQHVQQAPPPLRVLNASVSAPVEAVVLRALAKRREDRPQSAKELADELSVAVAGTTASHGAGDATIVAPDRFSASQVARTMLQNSLLLVPKQIAAAPVRGGLRVGILIGLAAALVLLAAWFGAQRTFLQRNTHAGTHAALGSSPRPNVYGLPPGLYPNGNCNSLNQADLRGMETAISEFHKNVVAHKWESAAWYENTSTFLPLESMETGYQNTMESIPAIVNVNGCRIMVSLKFQDYGQPQYCINLQYVMEYAREPTPRWIIEDARSIDDKHLCS
jgi:tRNA A-37 threonylcarbamoyl transferase component Bud32